MTDRYSPYRVINMKKKKYDKKSSYTSEEKQRVRSRDALAELIYALDLKPETSPSIRIKDDSTLVVWVALPAGVRGEWYQNTLEDVFKEKRYIGSIGRSDDHPNRHRAYNRVSQCDAHSNHLEIVVDTQDIDLSSLRQAHAEICWYIDDPDEAPVTWKKWRNLYRPGYLYGNLDKLTEDIHVLVQDLKTVRREIVDDS